MQTDIVQLKELIQKSLLTDAEKKDFIVRIEERGLDLQTINSLELAIRRVQSKFELDLEKRLFKIEQQAEAIELGFTQELGEFERRLKVSEFKAAARMDNELLQQIRNKIKLS